MAYDISISFMELQALAKVTIFGVSEFHKSVQISQFQCVGWLLEIDRAVKRKIEKEWILNPDYATEALVRVARLSEQAASELMGLASLQEQFEYVWSYIGEDERKTAIHMNFEHYDNFWPGFDVYSRAWSRSLCLMDNESQSAVTAHDSTLP
ncbi:hypothetical protein [Pseudomonas sp. BNK-43-a]|uniref:hypothetical protein n=1 Tax=unclassified Pseudomonas TaxID=196821 RepID=UPI0039BEF522